MIPFFQQKFRFLCVNPKGRRSSSQKGFILAAVLGLVVILEIMLSGVFINMLAQFKASDTRVTSQESFYLAETGIQRAIFELRQNATWLAGESGYPFLDNVAVNSILNNPATRVGTYDLQAHTAPDWNTLHSIYIRSDGVSDRTPVIRRTILARVVAISSSAFFTSSLGRVRISAGSNITGDIVGGSLDFGVAGNINVNGAAFYASSVTGNLGPNVNITGGVTQTSSVGFTGLDLPRYLNLAATGGSFYSGDLYLGGVIDKASWGNSNGVIYVDGDVYFDDGTTYADDMMIVATGNIYLSGSLKNDANPLMGQAGNKQIGLMAAGNVKISSVAPNNMQLEAFILADGGVLETEGAAGSINGTLDFSGSISVRGNSDLSNPNASGINLTAFTNRNLSYNQQFKLENKIPFQPSVISIIEWLEINPNDTVPITTLP